MDVNNAEVGMSCMDTENVMDVNNAEVGMSCMDTGNVMQHHVMAF